MTTCGLVGVTCCNHFLVNSLAQFMNIIDLWMGQLFPPASSLPGYIERATTQTCCQLFPVVTRGTAAKISCSHKSFFVIVCRYKRDVCTLDIWTPLTTNKVNYYCLYYEFLNQEGFMFLKLFQNIENFGVE